MAGLVRDGLAALVHSVRFEDLPREVVRETKWLILDTLACALGGVHGRPSRIVGQMVRELGGGAESSLIGGGRSSCALATLYNGTLLRYLDQNDYYFGLDSAHPSGNLAAGLAVAQRASRSGAELIAALVAAYEVHLRLCDVVAAPGISARGWHPATNAQFSSAALAARLLSDDLMVTANAISLAGSQNNTLAQMQRGDLPMSKAVAEAMIAKGGVEAALLAAAGLTGPAEIFEGVAGWAKAVAGGVDFDALIAPLGQRFRLMETCMKPYSAVAGAMAPIQAAIDLRLLDGVEPADITSVRVLLPAVSARKAADPKKLAPKDKETADHSVHYCVAVGLLDAACGEAQFSAARIASTDIAAMIGRMNVVEDAELTALWPAAGGAVAVALRDGRVIERRHRQPPGHPANRIDDAALARKFHDMADGVLTRAQAEAAMAEVDALDRAANPERLMAALAGG